MNLNDLIKKDDIASIKDLLHTHNLNQKDKDGYSFLHIAIANNSNNTVKYLIDNGIDVNLTDSKGQTSLHYTAIYNQINVAKLILEKEGNLNIIDHYGNNPLWTAVFNVKGRSERYDIVELFLKAGASSRNKNKAGRSAHDFAIQVGNEKLVALIEKYITD